ncbi:uncharacterized protein VTP21DRAFT_7968 [Calcarisporiella thermophila]|uniref:uncharacterized protein n=1 Tax=Calcarisporiella thermophila TaxID=911321 RepID=UPI003744418E
MADAEQQNTAKSVLYCGVCTMPPEYCEFGPTPAKCKKWIQKAHVDLYERYYGTQELEKKMEEVSVDDKPEPEEKKTKEEKKLEREAEKRKHAKIQLKRIERNKRKSVTSIYGLEVFGVDLKKAAKLFANKYACGSSVVKNPQGLDEIVIQGDVIDEVRELILQTWKEINPDNVEIVEEKKKKKSEN